jgi:hypothetical protein
MLTFRKAKNSRKIARVVGGKRDGQFVYLSTDEPVLDPKDLTPAFFERHPEMKRSDAERLREALKEQNPPNDKELLDVYLDAIKDIQDRNKSEIRISDGKLQPLPNRDVVEKIYVSAPSGAGKSTWCGKWLREYKRMWRGNEVFMFSTVGEDKAIDKYNPERIDLDEDLLENPVDPEELRDSVCIFDDIDSHMSVPVRKYICGLRDWELEMGRHFKTRLLCTSHLLMNYTSTRRLLNEATAVVIFPKSGSTYHIKQYMKKYAGLEKRQIKRILSLPSRWVALYRTYPMYVLYEKGAYLLAGEDDD